MNTFHWIDHYFIDDKMTDIISLWIPRSECPISILEGLTCTDHRESLKDVANWVFLTNGRYVSLRLFNTLTVFLAVVKMSLWLHALELLGHDHVEWIWLPYQGIEDNEKVDGSTVSVSSRDESMSCNYVLDLLFFMANRIVE